MYDTERNKHHLYIRDNLTIHILQQPHKQIQLKGKKQVLESTNSKMLFVKRNLKFKDKIFKLF